MLYFFGGGLFRKWFINVDNSRQFWSAINQTLRQFALSHRLVNRAIGQWRRRLECIVQQQSGHIEHYFDLKTEMLQLRWTLPEVINRLFCY